MSQANHAQNMPPVDSVAFCRLREDHKVHGIQSAFFKPQIAIPRPIGRGVAWDNHFHIAVLLATQNRRSGRRGLGREPRIWSSKGCGLSQVECKQRWSPSEKFWHRLNTWVHFHYKDSCYRPLWQLAPIVWCVNLTAKIYHCLAGESSEMGRSSLFAVLPGCFSAVLLASPRNRWPTLTILEL